MKMVTLKFSPPAVSVPRAYFIFERPAMWLMSNDRGVCESKKAFRIWRAWLLLELFSEEMMEISRLSSNQAESFSESPCVRYLEMGTKTSFPSVWARRLTQRRAVKKHNEIYLNAFISRAFSLQILSHIAIFAEVLERE